MFRQSCLFRIKACWSDVMKAEVCQMKYRIISYTSLVIIQSTYLAELQKTFAAANARVKLLHDDISYKLSQLPSFLPFNIRVYRTSHSTFYSARYYVFFLHLVEFLCTLIIALSRSVTARGLCSLGFPILGLGDGRILRRNRGIEAVYALSQLDIQSIRKTS